MPTTRLVITGFRGRAVPNEFIAQQQPTDRVALLLPGMGYTCDMPLFYYLENQLRDNGWDLLRLEYAYGRNPEFVALTPTEQDRWIAADAEAGHAAAVSARTGYRRVAIVGKSLGTLAMGRLLRSPLANHLHQSGVWLTPILADDGVRSALLNERSDDLVIIGDRDHWFDAGILADARTVGHSVVVVAGANHSLDIAGDVPGSLAAVGTAIAAISGFLPPVDSGSADVGR